MGEAGTDLSGEQRIPVHEDGLHPFQDPGLWFRDLANPVQLPGAIRLISHTDEANLSRSNLDGIECMMPSRTSSIGHLEGGEVECRKEWPVRCDEPLPIIDLGPPWCWRDAMALQHVGDGAITDSDFQVGKPIANGILTPGRVVVGHLHDECFGLGIEPWASGSFR